MADLASVRAKLATALAEADAALATPPDPIVIAPSPQLNALQLNLSALVCVVDQYASSRYERFQTPLILTADRAVVFRRTNIAVGGDVSQPFAYAKYGLLIGGVERATYVRKGEEREGTFAIALGGESDDWYESQIIAYDSAGTRVTQPLETLMRFWIGIDRNGKLKDCPDFVLETNSFEWTHLGATHFWSRVPKTMQGPVANSLTPVAATPFNTPLPSSKIVRMDLVPATSDPYNQLHTPVINTRGVVLTTNMQHYFYADMIADFPQLPQIDGPRGVATFSFATYLRGGRNGKWYANTPNATVVFDAAGTKRTLAGIRHRYAPLASEAKKNGPEVENVGTWDASIPASLRTFREPWAMYWDAPTLAIDDNAPLVGTSLPEHPHVGAGPRMFINDSAHSRVLALQFDGHDRSVPPVITQLFAAADPWGGDFDPASGLIIVNERAYHRVSLWNPATGAHVNDVVSFPQGAAYGVINSIRVATLYRSLADARAVPILFPEGGCLQDGYWYFASKAQGEVRRVNLQTGVVEVCCRPSLDGNSKYVFIALSDDTFGPRGTIFVTTFSNNTFGMPQAFVPSPGRDPDGTSLTHSQRWTWFQWAHDVIRGNASEAQAYSGACAVANGMLASSTSSNGFDIFRQADPSLDQPIDYARAARGAAYYRLKGYHVLYGAFGNNRPTKYPLPFGENADCDYFLLVAGHAPD